MSKLKFLLYPLYNRKMNDIPLASRKVIAGLVEYVMGLL